MAFYDWISETMIDDGGRRPVSVGWLLNDSKGGVLFDDPERLRSAGLNREHAKSASRCPAVINLESRYFVIKCPFDVHLRFERDKDGKPRLKNMAGEKSPVRSNKLGEAVRLVNEVEWRYADRPTLQIQTPYLFIADEPVFINQLPPFLDYLARPWPGTLFGGRFPVHIWPRPLMWAFEWHDPTQDLVLKRGEPWFYVHFETENPSARVRLVEQEMTPELTKYLDGIIDVSNYVNKTYSLFGEARRLRPDKLLKPKS